MSLTEIWNIGLMQGFAGLSLFSVLLLMGLGLAIIFGQMGVINMAHGEFMTIGAYTIYLGSTLTEKYAPGLVQMYFPVAIVAAFLIAFAAGPWQRATSTANGRTMSAATTIDALTIGNITQRRVRDRAGQQRGPQPPPGAVSLMRHRSGVDIWP